MFRLVIHDCPVVESEVPIGDTNKCPYCGKHLNNEIHSSDSAMEKKND